MDQKTAGYPYHEIEIQGYARVVATITEKRIEPTKCLNLRRNFDPNKLAGSDDYWKAFARMVVINELSEQFRQQLRNNPELKGRVGRTQWNVIVESVTYTIIKPTTNKE